MWPFAVRKTSGYGAHNVSSGGIKRNVDAHRHVCERAHGAAPSNKHHAAHRCGNRLCVNPAHLYWADARENMADAKRHGRLRGGGRYRQRFHAEQIEDICGSGESLLALAAKYATDVSYVGRLRRRHAAGVAV